MRKSKFPKIPLNWPVRFPFRSAYCIDYIIVYIILFLTRLYWLSYPMNMGWVTTYIYTWGGLVQRWNSGPCPSDLVLVVLVSIVCMCYKKKNQVIRSTGNFVLGLRVTPTHYPPILLATVTKHKTNRDYLTYLNWLGLEGYWVTWRSAYIYASIPQAEWGVLWLGAGWPSLEYRKLARDEVST